MAVDVKTFFWTVVGWAFVAVFALLTIGAASGGGGLIALLIGAVLVTLCAPPFRTWVLAKTNLRLGGWPFVVGCFALVSIQMHFSGEGSQKLVQEEENKKAQESAQRVATERETRKKEFEANKPAILADISSKIQAGQLAEAQAQVARFYPVTQDMDLARLKAQADLVYAKAQLEGVDQKPLSKQVEIYGLLAALEPSNRQYVERAKQTKARQDMLQAELKAAEERLVAKEVRRKEIERQFSTWDGSHRNVEKTIKASLKNPDSYQHVETKYRDLGDKIMVTTTVRATNSFGGIVPNSFVAEVDNDGNVLSLRSLN